jgi:multidrug efflux system membrane fusion protein
MSSFLCGRKSFSYLLAIFSVAAMFFEAGCGGASTKSAQAGMGPQVIPVAVQTVERRDMPYFLTGLGNVTAFNTVAVKSRVDGQIVKIAFTEGQLVKQGDLLIEIDPRPYQVALEQAQANLARDQSQLKNARIDYDRYQGLYKEGVIAQQQFDGQRALVGQLEGTVQADQAAIDNAKLNLVYTNITAPVSGRVGLRQVDIGNMIHATDTTSLVVLTQLQPIAVIFTLPEDVLPRVSKQLKRGALEVDAYSRDDKTKLATGKLLTIDNQIDLTTGTGKLKAVFENSDNALWPNQFVNAHLLLETHKDAIVMPAAALQRGPQGTYVYVVKPDKTVEIRPVQVAFTQDTLTTVQSGLTEGESVVTDGQDKLQNGSRVEPHTGTGGAAAKAVQTVGTAGQ